MGSTDQETVYALGAVDEMLADLARRRGERECSRPLAKLRAVRHEIVADIIDGFEESERRLSTAADAAAQIDD